jgi:hypothetical protein
MGIVYITTPSLSNIQADYQSASKRGANAISVIGQQVPQNTQKYA